MGSGKPKADLLPGTLDMLVLKVLMRGHLHGYAIAQLIQQLSDDLLRVEEGSLYPALQRLELNGWIEGEWGLSANNRRARFYKLTADGRKHLAAEVACYRPGTGAVARVIGFACSLCWPARDGNAFDGGCVFGSTTANGSGCCGKRWNFTSSP